MCRRGTVSRGGWLAIGLLALGLCSAPLAGRADVGYAMRGDARPFHHWDSMFNNTQDASAGQGLVWRAGDVDVRPTLGTWLVADDNIFLSHTNAVDDTYWTLAPGVVLLYGQADDNYLTANYEFENTDYADNSGEDFESHLFSAGLQYLARGYTTHVSDQFSQTTDTDPESAQRVKRLDNTADARVDRQISRRTGADVHGRYDVVSYDSDTYLDYNDVSGGLEFRHQTWPKTHLTLGGDYGRVNVKGDGDIGDADYVEAAVGLRGEPVSRTSVEARLGYQHREFDADYDTIDTWVASVGAARTFWRESVAGVNISRRLLPSSQAEGLTRVPLTIAPYVQHEILRDRLALSVSGGYETADYYDANGKTDRSDERWYVTGLLDGRLHDALTVGVGYTREEQDADVMDDSYTQNLVFVRALVNY
ncbi:MAG: outer membrane beta-barrel protein [Lentisphaerae bacterium]|nr:outer membrane beta-barrel protein [Lentisphaerota bacterium]